MKVIYIRKSNITNSNPAKTWYFHIKIQTRKTSPEVVSHLITLVDPFPLNYCILFYSNDHQLLQKHHTSPVEMNSYCAQHSPPPPPPEESGNACKSIKIILTSEDRK